MLELSFEHASDEELLAAYVSGYPRALEALLLRRRDFIWSLSLKFLGNATLAEEAMQEASIALFKRAHQFKGDSKFTTWMYQIVHNCAMDVARKYRKSDVHVDVDQYTETFSVEDQSDEITSRQAVMKALMEIDPDQRAALVLVVMEGLSVEEASTTLGVPAGTIKSRCSRGKAALATLLSELDPRLSQGNLQGNLQGNSEGKGSGGNQTSAPIVLGSENHEVENREGGQ